MAIDEVLLLQKKDNGNDLPNILRFYGWSPGCCSIGIHQDLEAEINIEAVKKAGKDYVRRISGGGAVYHDSVGELTYSVVVNSKDYGLSNVDFSFMYLSNWIIAGLTKTGLDLAHNKIHCPSLFTASRRKLSGNAQARKGDYILQHGTILLKYDPSEMYTYLKVKEGRSKSKMVQSVYANVTTLENETGKFYQPGEIIPALVEAFEKQFGTALVEARLTADEIKKARKLSQDKYSTDTWNFHGKVNSLGLN